MPKNITCRHCKYLIWEHKEGKKDTTPKYIFRTRTLSVFTPSEDYYYCEAELTKVSKEELDKVNNCPHFRNRTKTAWQEVGEEIIKFIPDLLGKIFKKQ